MKLTVTLFYLCIFFSACSPNEPSKEALQEAKECVEALQNQNWDKFISYTYPLVVTKVGGKEKMLKLLKDGARKMRAQGITLECLIGEVKETITIDDTIYVLIPEKITSKIGGRLYHMESHLIGISKDEGKSWWFLDANKLNNEKNFKNILPRLYGKMIIPPSKQTGG